MHNVIAFIGAGNMGSSLIGGLIQNGYTPNQIWASDPSEEKLRHLKTKFNIGTTQNNDQAIASADVVIFAVKPQVFAQIASALSAKIRLHHPLIMSVAAGIREASIQHWLGGEQAIVRVMPNTPALIGCGASALYANSFVSEAQHELAESIMRAVGVIVWLENEKQMDTVTALSGCGPAYFFLMMEALQAAAEELGLPSETARLLTLETGLGAVRMAIESGATLTELRQRVASPGGSTEKALSVLEENNIRDIYKKALLAAKLRSEELGK